MSEKTREELVEIIYTIGLTIKAHNDTFKNKTQDETAEWIRNALVQMNVYTVPMGSI